GGLGIGGRALTMLGVVPDWFRLFLWPAHLQADYSPQEIMAATHWGGAQTLGAALLILTGWIAWMYRRSRPQVTFGILWAAIGVSLVSNVAFATGIVLAERTLFLASMGVVMAAGDLFWLAGSWIYVRSSLGRIAVVTSLLVLLAMGLSRSASRQLVWHDLVSLWYQTVIDAPLSYRAHHAYGAVLFDVKMERSAEVEYRRAIQLFPKGIPVYNDLADKYRVAGHCEPAIREYQEILRMVPGHISARASEVACLLYLGRYREAAAEARIGASWGVQTKSLVLYAEIADSAARVHAPLHSINLPPPVDSAPKQP
ncbi:MAG: tetratricopeptide repeat protein, partial [Gemmatimonadales bacterium]